MEKSVRGGGDQASTTDYSIEAFIRSISSRIRRSAIVATVSRTVRSVICSSTRLETRSTRSSVMARSALTAVATGVAVAEGSALARDSGFSVSARDAGASAAGATCGGGGADGAGVGSSGLPHNSPGASDAGVWASGAAAGAAGLRPN